MRDSGSPIRCGAGLTNTTSMESAHHKSSETDDRGTEIHLGALTLLANWSLQFRYLSPLVRRGGANGGGANGTRTRNPLLAKTLKLPRGAASVRGTRTRGERMTQWPCALLLQFAAATRRDDHQRQLQPAFQVRT